MNKIGIVGPHGSGNRLVMRIADHAFPSRPGDHAIRSFPILPSSTDESGRPTILLRENWIPDLYLIQLREMSPWCQLRERHLGPESPTTLIAAKENWKLAYQQIHKCLGDFWNRSDVKMIRYRGIIDNGPQYAIDLMSEVLGPPLRGPYGENCECCINDDIVDGDLKYDANPETLSIENWIKFLQEIPKG